MQKELNDLKNKWRAQAKVELSELWSKGVLDWQYDPLIPLKAYYDASDLSLKDYVAAYSSWQIQTQKSPSTPWRALIYHSICNAADANTIGGIISSGTPISETGLWLDTTKEGCESIASILDNFTKTSPFVALRYTAENHNFDAPFIKHFTEKIARTSGLLWRQGNPLGCPPNIPIVSTFPVRAWALDGYTAADLNASPSDELGWVLAQAIYYLNTASDKKLNLQEMCKSLFVVSGVGLDYFHEIAKLRAIRRLLSQVAAAYEVMMEPSDWYVAGISHGNQHAHWDVEMNLIRNTTQTLAAVIGGCTAVVVRPHTCSARGQETLSSRQLCAQLMDTLRYEAELQDLKSADPGAGAFFIAHLTEAIACAAWRTMQGIQSRGGCQHKKAQDWFQARLIDNQARAAKALATREAILVGTNAYAAPKAASTQVAQKGLILRSAQAFAAPYEALRTQAQAALSQHKGLHLRWYSPEIPSSAEVKNHPILSFLTEAWALVSAPSLKTFSPKEKNASHLILHLCVSDLKTAEQALSTIQVIPDCVWVVGYLGDQLPPTPQQRSANYHILNISIGTFYEHLHELVHKSFPAHA